MLLLKKTHLKALDKDAKDKVLDFNYLFSDYHNV